MDYKTLNDYELIYQVREHDEVAYGLLLEKYSHLVDMLAKMYIKNNKNLGLEYDDLYQEGMIGILKALDDYNSSDTLFYTYASLCARREIDKTLLYYKRKKHMILNDAISINQKVNIESDFSVEDTLASDYNLEKEYESSERCNKILDFKYELDILDSSILELKANGFSVNEISKLLDITYKAVDYRIRKIRKKLCNYSY